MQKTLAIDNNLYLPLTCCFCDKYRHNGFCKSWKLNREKDNKYCFAFSDEPKTNIQQVFRYHWLNNWMYLKNIYSKQKWSINSPASLSKHLDVHEKAIMRLCYDNEQKIIKTDVRAKLASFINVNMSCLNCKYLHECDTDYNICDNWDLNIWYEHCSLLNSIDVKNTQFNTDIYLVYRLN